MQNFDKFTDKITDVVTDVKLFKDDHGKNDSDDPDSEMRPSR